eukprot:g10694.t1
MLGFVSRILGFPDDDEFLGSHHHETIEEENVKINDKSQSEADDLPIKSNEPLSSTEQNLNHRQQSHTGSFNKENEGVGDKRKQDAEDLEQPFKRLKVSSGNNRTRAKVNPFGKANKVANQPPVLSRTNSMFARQTEEVSGDTAPATAASSPLSSFAFHTLQDPLNFSEQKNEDNEGSSKGSGERENNTTARSPDTDGFAFPLDPVQDLNLHPAGPNRVPPRPTPLPKTSRPGQFDSWGRPDSISRRTRSASRKKGLDALAAEEEDREAAPSPDELGSPEGLDVVPSPHFNVKQTLSQMRRRRAERMEKGTEQKLANARSRRQALLEENRRQNAERLFEAAQRAKEEIEREAQETQRRQQELEQERKQQEEAKKRRQQEMEERKQEEAKRLREQARRQAQEMEERKQEKEAKRLREKARTQAQEEQERTKKEQEQKQQQEKEEETGRRARGSSKQKQENKATPPTFQKPKIPSSSRRRAASSCKSHRPTSSCKSRHGSSKGGPLRTSPAGGPLRTSPAGADVTPRPARRQSSRPGSSLRRQAQGAKGGKIQAPDMTPMPRGYVTPRAGSSKASPITLSSEVRRRQVKRAASVERRAEQRKVELQEQAAEQKSEAEERARLQAIYGPRIARQIEGKSYAAIVSLYLPKSRLSGKPDSDTLRRSMKRAMARYHPDRARQLPLSKRVEHEEIFAMLNKLYMELTDYCAGQSQANSYRWADDDC